LPAGPAGQPLSGSTNRLPAAASSRLLVEALNDGETAAAFGEGAFTLTLRVPRGSLRGVASLEGFDTFETLCEPGAEPAQDPSRQASPDARARRASLRPCGAARASVVRLGARSWNIGAVARAGLSFEPGAPSSLPATVAVRRDDGGEWSRALTVSLKP
jgi:hypothetical protein